MGLGLHVMTMAILNLQGNLTFLFPLPGVVLGPSFNGKRKETPAEHDADNRDDEVENHHYIVCLTGAYECEGGDRSGVAWLV